MSLKSPEGFTYNIKVDEVPQVSFIRNGAEPYYDTLYKGVWLWLSGCILIVGFSVLWFTNFGKSQLKSRQLRGQSIVAASVLIGSITTYNRKRAQEAKRRKNKDAFIPKPPVIVGFPYPHETEVEHTLITGSPGSGKTVAIHSLLDSIRQRHDRAIIIDTEGALHPPPL